ncbi:non-ribosomal peptide synthetase component E (peptide arylation enzyme) [Bradyrhizobium elkanii]|jgi:non-ribosomal peptide synthetase component E (peptide arylation enzyme)
MVRPAGATAGRVFRCIQDLLAKHTQNALERHAIPVPARLPMTYFALWTKANEVVFGLRKIGVRRTDRGAVVCRAEQRLQ